MPLGAALDGGGDAALAADPPIAGLMDGRRRVSYRPPREPPRLALARLAPFFPNGVVIVERTAPALVVPGATFMDFFMRRSVTQDACALRGGVGSVAQKGGR